MRLNLIFLVFVFCLIVISNVSAEVTGEIVTGEATTQKVGMSVSIVIILPSLTLTKPENETYINNQTIPLNYSQTGALQVWYNLDNGANTTITQNMQLSINEGSHTLNLYANNSKGVVTQNVTFLVDSTKFRILYEEYKGDNKGESTNFDYDSYEDLQAKSNVILENTNFGKIIFNGNINLTDDEDFSDNQVDLDNYINISQNRIELNSTALPNFNKTATLSIYNLSFDDPRILRDNEICPSSICTGAIYSEGTLIFNVTGFTIYSAEETPEGEESGVIIGGGSGVARIREFEVDVEQIQISLKQGETKEKEIIIRNIGNQKLDFVLESSEFLKDFIKIGEEKFELDAGESKKISLDFIARENTVPNLYLGELIVRAGNVEKRIFIAVEVESKGLLFDVSVEIPKKFRQILPGEEISVNVEVFNFGEIKKGDVKIEYFLKNENGEIIILEEETVAVETRMSLIKTFQLPSDIAYGNYVVYVRVIYNKGDVASASAWFSVVSIAKPSRYREIIIYVFLVLLFLVLVWFIILIYLKKRKRKRKKRK